MNSYIKALRKTGERKLIFQNLELETLRIVAYSDASFANNDDLTSQLGFIVFLTDGTGRCNLVHASSHKCRRVTRLILGGEVLAFADAFDYAFTLRHDLEHMLGRSIPLSMLTDSKSLFDVISKSSTTLERRLMIDIAVSREAYNTQELSDIGLVRSEYNPADAFTKAGNCRILDNILRTGRLDHPVVQWVIRQMR
jgi:hypothetical protein